MNKIIFDLDGTITELFSGKYGDEKPNSELISKMREYKELGYEIVIHTARNMRTHDGNLGKINKHTLPIIIQWLEQNNVPYDEIYVGKPWCGPDGFYVDDRAIRPSEFELLTLEEIKGLIND